MSWVWLAEVRAEKEMRCATNSLGMPFSSLSAVVRVFPVPVGPTHSIYGEKAKITVPYMYIVHVYHKAHTHVHVQYFTPHCIVCLHV